MRRIILVLAAIAGLFALAAPAAAMASNGPGQSISAYYWQSNGHALGGPQSMANGASFSNGYLALVAENVHGQNINGMTITVTGYLDPSTLVQYQGQPDGSGIGSLARVWFDGAGGTSAQSPQGYLGQVWWAHPSSAVLDLNNYKTGAFTLTVTVDPSAPGVWSDWNGKDAYDNQTLFTGAASAVQQIGLSFGGGFFFENGDTGTGSIQVTSITVS
jgi:hypothetical protein